VLEEEAIDLHTCVKGRHFALVARPEVVGLVLCVLGRASKLFVGVVFFHLGLSITVKSQVEVNNAMDFYKC
jgi:hypothetical protein